MCSLFLPFIISLAIYPPHPLVLGPAMICDGLVFEESEAKRRRTAEDDLHVSDVMRAANVWSGVWVQYEKDLAAEMLHILGRPGPYSRSSDWSNAWVAVHNTRELYETHVRNVTLELLTLNGSPDSCLAAVMARGATKSLVFF